MCAAFQQRTLPIYSNYGKSINDVFFVLLSYG